MTMTEQPTLLHKNLPVSGVKILDDEKGIVEAFVAGIGNKDSVGDIIQPGAFIDSLQTRWPKGVWSHNWDIPVSKTLEIYEVAVGDPRLPAKMASRGAGGLYVKTQFNLETQRGREAYSDVKFFGEESEWSIGYMEKEAEFSKDLGANLLHKIELYEYSPVLFGANPLTSTVGVKVQFGADGDFKIQVQGLANSDLEAKVADAVKGALEAKAAVEGSDDVEGKAKTHTFMPGGEDGTCKICGKAKDDAVHDTEDGGKSAGDVEETKEAGASGEGRKVVPGSMEARRSAICEAVEDAFPGYNAWPVATFENSVVVEVYESYALEMAEVLSGTEGTDADETADESKEGYWLFPYTLGADGAAVLGAPQQVDVVEVVVAKAAMDQLAEKGNLTDEARALIAEKVAPLGLDAKAGRVLSSKNLDRLTTAKTAIEEVLGSADAMEPEGDEKTVEGEGEQEEKTLEGGEVEKTEDLPVETKSNAVCGQMFKSADGAVVPCEKAPGHEDVLHGVPEAEEKSEGDVEDEADDDETADDVEEKAADPVAPHVFVAADGGADGCEVCSAAESLMIHDEHLLTALSLLAEESAEKATEFLAALAKAGAAIDLAALDALSDEAIESVLKSAVEAGVLAEKADDADDPDLSALVAAIESSIDTVVTEAAAGSTEKAWEVLAAADAAVDALVAAVEAASVEESKSEEESEKAEMVTLDSVTLLELELILADTGLES